MTRNLVLLLSLSAGAVLFSGFSTSNAWASPPIGCESKLQTLETERSELLGKVRDWFADKSESRDFFADPRFKWGVKRIRDRRNKVSLPLLAEDLAARNENADLLERESGEKAWALRQINVRSENLSLEARSIAGRLERWRSEEFLKLATGGAAIEDPVPAIEWARDQLRMTEDELARAEGRVRAAKNERDRIMREDERDDYAQERRLLASLLTRLEQLPDLEKQAKPLQSEVARLGSAAEAARTDVVSANAAFESAVREQLALDDLDGDRSIQIEISQGKLILCDSLRLIPSQLVPMGLTTVTAASCAKVDLEEPWIEPYYGVQTNWGQSGLNPSAGGHLEEILQADPSGATSETRAALMSKLGQQILAKHANVDPSILDCQKSAQASRALPQGAGKVNAAGAI